MVLRLELELTRANLKDSLAQRDRYCSDLATLEYEMRLDWPQSRTVQAIYGCAQSPPKEAAVKDEEDDEKEEGDKKEEERMSSSYHPFDCHCKTVLASSSTSSLLVCAAASHHLDCRRKAVLALHRARECLKCPVG